MEITLEQLDRLRVQSQNIQLVDVRSPGEFAAGHVPGAVNIPMDQIEARLPDLDKEKVVLLCQSGRRASMTCDLLKGHHPEVMTLAGGTNAWVEAGRDVVASTRSRWSLERQVRLGAGLMVLTGATLGFLVNPAWFGLAAFVGAGLTFAGATDICAMGSLLAKMPWNQPKPNSSQHHLPSC